MEDNSSCAPNSLAHSTLSLRLQGCKHDDHRIVSRRSLDEAPKLISIHPDDRTLGGPLHHLCHLL